MKESIKIESIRHLNDLDDISSGKRDGNIESGQELIVEKYAKFLNNELKVENKKALFL